MLELLFQQNEHQDIKLCDQCSRKVARRTVNNKDVISALSSVVKEIVNTMSNTIITKNMRQTIQSTTNDDQALGHLRDVSFNLNNNSQIFSKEATAGRYLYIIKFYILYM